ncbi:MAG TPA: hypothetical protein GXX51_01315 [Firmicutes bacterium]|nr:hypothetical protein [Bacillota bacterium]
MICTWAVNRHDGHRACRLTALAITREAMEIIAPPGTMEIMAWEIMAQHKDFAFTHNPSNMVK